MSRLGEKRNGEHLVTVPKEMVARSSVSSEVGGDDTAEAQQERFMLQFRQPACVLRFSGMLLSRAGLASQKRLESFPRFRVIKQGFQGQQCHGLDCSRR